MYVEPFSTIIYLIRRCFFGRINFDEMPGLPSNSKGRNECNQTLWLEEDLVPGGLANSFESVAVRAPMIELLYEEVAGKTSFPSKL